MGFVTFRFKNAPLLCCIDIDCSTCIESWSKRREHTHHITVLIRRTVQYVPYSHLCLTGPTVASIAPIDWLIPRATFYLLTAPPRAPPATFSREFEWISCDNEWMKLEWEWINQSTHSNRSTTTICCDGALLFVTNPRLHSSFIIHYRYHRIIINQLLDHGYIFIKCHLQRCRSADTGILSQVQVHTFRLE